MERPRTLELPEYKKVVRVFLLQTNNGSLLQSNEDLKQFSAIDVIMSKKNDQAKNPSQIMPPGGNVNKSIKNGITEDEDLYDAARREILEETHILMSDLKKLDAVQEYSFTNKDGIQHREATFFVGQLYGMRYDTPWPLDNEEDKIESFPQIPSVEVEKLFQKGEYNNSPLLDSLHTNEQYRESMGTYTNTRDVFRVQEELTTLVQKEEIKQKVKILNIIFAKKETHSDVYQKWKNIRTAVDTQTAENQRELYNQIEVFWQLHIIEIAEDYTEVQKAIAVADLEYVIRDLVSNQQEGRKPFTGLPTIHMMFSTLFGFDFTKDHMHLTQEHPHLKKLMSMARGLWLYSQTLVSVGSDRKEASKRLLKKIIGKHEGDVTKQDMFAYLQREFGFAIDYNRESFAMLGEEVDMLFTELQVQSLVDPNKANLQQRNEVQGKNFDRLTELACSNSESYAGYQIKFEAQRKLLLVYLFTDIRAFHESVRLKGTQPLDDLESELEVKAGRPLQSAVRILSIKGKEYNVVIERNRKTIGSLLRKVLVRDIWDMDGNKNGYQYAQTEYNDIYRESYTFDEGAMIDTEVAVYETPCVMTDGKKKLITAYKAPRVVHNFIQELVQKANQKTENISIDAFKELPEEGGTIESNGPGGGGSIRMCKFYVKHTDKDLIVRMREVQIFLPNKKEDGTVISGMVDFKNKKEDDDAYSMKRLFTQGHTYSLIELLFPHHIYGDQMKALFPVLKNK